MGSDNPHPSSALAVTSVKIERDKLEAFKALAVAERRSVSQQLRFLIDRAIAEHEAERASAAEEAAAA